MQSFPYRRLWKRIKKQFLAWLKRFLRACYRAGRRMGRTTCLFLAGALVLVIIGLTLIISIPKTKAAKTEAMARQLAEQITPVPSATPSPIPLEYYATPTPEPTLWIAKGGKGDDVLELQARLMRLGYLDIDEPTSYFGDATKFAVKLFQRQHDLQQDGIAGEQTMALLFSDEAQHYVMKEGAEGDDIVEFQRMLVDLGYLERRQVTGYYGTDTVNAVIKFQRRNHLTKDGKAGEQTIEAINSPDARVSYTRELEIKEEQKKAAAAARAQTAEGRIDKLISAASSKIGKPYVLGSRGPNSFDCSGLVYYSLQAAHVYCRRLNAAGYSRTMNWTKINSMDALKRGDLIFFRSDDSSSIGHVAIYAGGGMMIDASSANGKVVKRSCTGAWCRRNFVCARRPIE